MTKLLSLYGKTVNLIVTVFIISFTVLSLAFMSMSASDERDRVRDLERTIMLANSYVRDFIITRDPSIAKDTELILREADLMVQKGIRAKNYQRLRNEVLMYLHSIGNLIEAYQDRGFYEEDGIEGKIRARMISLEELLQNAGEEGAMLALLRARRQEKNYMLYGKEEYVDGVHRAIDFLMSELSKSELDSSIVKEILDGLETYQHDFDRYVWLTDKVDWIQSELDYFRVNIGLTLSEVIEAEQIRSRRFLWTALSLILLAFVFGIMYAMYVARSILNPLNRLKRAVNRVAEGEDVEASEVFASGELSELMVSFQEVAEQIRLRKNAEENLLESKEAIQRHATELEARTEQLDAVVSDLENTRDESENALKRNAEFLASMSHEIRTPLNGIIGMTNLLSTEELRSDQKEVVDIIRTSGESLLGIVNHILDFSKIEAGAVVLEQEKFSLASCIEDSLGMVSRQAAVNDIDLSYKIETDVPDYIVGDSTRLRQILVNLVGNAVKFTHEGEIQVRVALNEKRGIQFYVEDTGIGISKDQLKFLFNPFTQADVSTTRRFGGTGLGLSISQGLVALMGGTMTVKSEIGRGSVFGFNIDVELSEFSSAPAPQFEGRRILLLNRATMFGGSMLSALSDYGIEIDETASEEDAAALLIEKEYFAVFINEGKNGFDGVAGVAVAGMLMEAAPHVSIIVLRHIDQPVQNECAQCLLKPVRHSALRHALLQIESKSRGEAAPGPPAEDHVIGTGAFSDRGARPMSRKSVLLVEDNLINQKVGVRMLEKLGCQVDVADNGEAAVAAVKTRTYDVVFMDIQMPGMDGLEATQQIRKLTNGVRQPAIIALTASATTQDRIKCLDAGMDDYTSKPVHSRTLELMLQRYSGARNRSSDTHERSASLRPDSASRP